MTRKKKASRIRIQRQYNHEPPKRKRHYRIRNKRMKNVFDRCARIVKRFEESSKRYQPDSEFDGEKIYNKWIEKRDPFIIIFAKEIEMFAKIKKRRIDL